MAEKQKVGEVFTYFAKAGVAGITLTDGSLSVGDNILFLGNTTNFQQTVESMQIEHNSVHKADPGQSIGMKVRDRVRPHDAVYTV
ncbi:MAG: translation elongation factor-like protein [Candidatus Altiarchaeota archaeon]|nr:translation elongation factor-like protein [Candidatus Altiarchaeota archaeon]